jgi:hypothetical protein
MTTCPLCDGDHSASGCPFPWDDRCWQTDDGDEPDLPLWTARLSLAPLMRALDESAREIKVLESVHTDEDQRQRLSRARRLVKAGRHLRLERFDEMDEELEAAEIARRGDVRNALVTGMAALLQDRVDDALARFEQVILGGADADRLDGLALAGRCLLMTGRLDDARKRFRAVVEDGDGLQRAEARYQLARCEVAGP